ncbi:MAG: hypothetical protein JSR77_03565 [Planctomycetes bacterium]|nr:hypothetical protein [Planctomycetota bacterium]
MSAPSPPSPSEIPFAKDYSPTKAFAHCFLPVVVGLAVALGVHMRFVLPRLGTGSPDLNRMIQMGHRLDTPLSDAPTLVFVGDSVTVEGIDASIVAKNAPSGWRVFNFGINGCDRAELDVVLPKVADAKPRAVCIVLRALSIGRPPDVEVDGAYAYNLGGFPAAWPPGWMESDTPGVPPEKVEMLRASRFKAEVHFRTAFQQLINNGLRARFRSGIKVARSDDWSAPFNMTASISGSTLDNHINVLGEEVREATADGTQRQERDLEKLISLLASKGVTPVLIISPTHPRLRETFGPTNARLKTVAQAWAAQYRGVYADASELFDGSGFADGQHLNEKGRGLLSQFVGSKLPAP